MNDDIHCTDLIIQTVIRCLQRRSTTFDYESEKFSSNFERFIDEFMTVRIALPRAQGHSNAIAYLMQKFPASICFVRDIGLKQRLLTLYNVSLYQLQPDLNQSNSFKEFEERILILNEQTINYGSQRNTRKSIIFIDNASVYDRDFIDQIRQVYQRYTQLFVLLG